MLPLRVQLVKRPDGGAVLRCRRADGSVTWQIQRGTRAAFFPGHDLTHFAVESELPGTVAFYGLIAAGWDIDETPVRGPAGRFRPMRWWSSTSWGCSTRSGAPAS